LVCCLHYDAYSEWLTISQAVCSPINHQLQSIQETRKSLCFPCTRNLVLDSNQHDNIHVYLFSDVPRMFQLQIGSTDDCTSWNESESTHFLDAVKEQISAGIASSCNCSRVQLHEVRFYCSKYPNYVSVRGYIRGSEGYTADEMLQCMEIWRSKPSTAILTDTKILNINKECKIDVLCWNEVECQPLPIVQLCDCNCCSDGLNTTNIAISPDP
jgi:hypothetical protein